jgi:hypothetical protein
MNRLFVLFAAIVMTFSTGCSCNEDRVYEDRPRRPQESSIQISADEFDGALLGRLFEQGKVSGGPAGVESFVNSQDNPINFLDLNKNGKIDYVQVAETREGSTVVLEFVVTQKDNPGLPIDQISVYTIRLNNSPNGYAIQGGHSSYVTGGTYFNHTVPHSHGLSFGEAYLLAHLFAPRPLYVSPGMGVGFMPRAYMAPSVRTSYATSYRNTNRITSIPRVSSAPQGFSAGPRAAKVSSTFGSRPGGGLDMNSGSGLQSFRSQQSSGSLNTSGFRSSPTTSTPSQASSPSRSSSGGSRSSFGGSRSSFGSSLGGRR